VFITSSYFDQVKYLRARPEPTRVQPFVLLDTKCRIQALPTNIRLGWQSLAMKNTLAYCHKPVKKFYDTGSQIVMQKLLSWRSRLPASLPAIIEFISYIRWRHDLASRRHSFECHFVNLEKHILFILQICSVYSNVCEKDYTN
jgi:hypothetical protein